MPSDPTKPVSLVRALSIAERQDGAQRLAVLANALEARDQRALERIVAGLLLSFPSGRASGAEAQVVVGAYVSAMSDLPPWAVNEAARRWTRGQVPGANTTFPPSSAELYGVAETIVQAFKFEEAMLERMLSGVVVNEPVPVLSRERKADVEANIQRIVAKAGLEQRAAAVGANAAELLKGMDNQPAPKTGFEKLTIPEPQ